MILVSNCLLIKKFVSKAFFTMKNVMSSGSNSEYMENLSSIKLSFKHHKKLKKDKKLSTKFKRQN